MIRLESSDFGDYLIIDEETKRDILIQVDYDYPGIASTFGWSPCACGLTDGTVNCEHKTASEMIQEAQEFLDDNYGKVVNDPGYF